MGEYADALTEDGEHPPDDMGRDEEIGEELARSEDDPTWTMRDGTRIKVSNMTTSHVRNALAMLKRKEAALDEFFPSLLWQFRRAFEAELKKRRTK